MSAPSGVDSLAPGTVVRDHFVIRAKLGGGGMGEVYLADNLEVEDKQYAIKVLLNQFSRDPRFAALLKAEAGKQARLEHDNVVGMYDFFAWNGHYCLVQSYVKGRTLAAMLEAQPGGLLDTVLDLMVGILAGLDYAHQKGILHCDVKPANVIVNDEGRPRVTDFGIARDIGAASVAVAGAGTVEYMSPEQIRPPYDIDHRSDVFSAGVLMFQVLCGRLPFASEPSRPVADSLQLDTDAPDIRSVRPDLPEPVARIVATALRRPVEERFQGCGDFSQAIQDYQRAMRWRRTWLPAIGVLSVVVLAGAFGLWRWQAHVAEAARLQDEANQREAAALLARKGRAIDEALHNTAVDLNLLCDGVERYRIFQDGAQRMRQIVQQGPTATGEESVRQMDGKVDSQRVAVARLTDTYRTAQQSLGQEPVELVEAGLARQATADRVVAAFVDELRADQATLRRGGELPAVDALDTRCAAGKAAAVRR